jgi:peptidoglycan hydrolase CwlO-like protein
MNKTVTIEPTTEEVQKIEGELLAIFAEMDRIDERIQKDQQEIDRLKAKTKAALAQLRAQ